MKKILTFLFIMISVVSVNLNAQENYNKTDKSGRRQGKWLDYHDNGQISCTGSFKDNEPVGEFVYYSKNGKIIAKGHYLNKNRHGRWEYFSEKNASLILEENYDNGLLVGISIVYNPDNNSVIEKTEYVDGKKQGAYTQYYDNGALMVKAFYSNDKLDGDYFAYYSNGNVKEEGRFKDGIKVGKWNTYDTDGNLLSTDMHEEENYSDPTLQDFE